MFYSILGTNNLGDNTEEDIAHGIKEVIAVLLLFLHASGQSSKLCPKRGVLRGLNSDVCKTTSLYKLL
jgi:hypothetical protein